MKLLVGAIREKWSNVKLMIYTLFYNEFISLDYAADTLMEPMFWFIDNFSKVLGPFFVAGVAFLILSVVVIAYLIGLPFYWNKSPMLTWILVIIGNWLLVNVVFHFYMAASTDPGYLKAEASIPVTVSICKRCIAPKPPRTHHCSICNRCVLKMDHHCPWLNNCVGLFNHRYFLCFCFYTALGTFFLIIFGAEVIYIDIFGNLDDVIVDKDKARDFSSNCFVKFIHYLTESLLGLQDGMDLPSYTNSSSDASKLLYRKYHACIIFETVLTSAVFIALTALTVWHVRLILKGESSIEKHINAKEIKRLTKLNKKFNNPYNFGVLKNLEIFMGLENGRNWYRNFLLPSRHKPVDNGYNWRNNYELNSLNIDEIKWKS